MDTSKIDDGGPAFPFVVPAPGYQHIEFGLSLRDWFAGQALSGIETSKSIITDAVFSDERADIVAQRAYEIADAMLKQRRKANV